MTKDAQELYCAPFELAFRDPRRNSWRWRPVLKKWGNLRLFINPNILKTATFLIVNDEPVSTVFFIGGHESIYYAVTTHHSVKHSRVSIRFNLKGVGTRDEPFEPDDWIPHGKTDIAILPLEISLKEFDIESVALYTLAENKDYIQNPAPPFDPATFLITPNRGSVLVNNSNPFGLAYGTGDEVFTVGLFEGHHGQSLAQSVARFGHIAMKPATGEKIMAEIDPPPSDLVPIDAFLVEMAAWKGQSGSPVFIRTRVEEQRLGLPTNEADYLIGMVQGFYPGEQDVRIDGERATLSPLNMGIAIVIPAADIRELLMREDVRKARQRLIDERRQRPKIRPSAASNGPE